MFHPIVSKCSYQVIKYDKAVSCSTKASQYFLNEQNCPILSRRNPQFCKRFFQNRWFLNE